MLRDISTVARAAAAAVRQHEQSGEQQMLALARVLMTAPKILIVDEPSVGLAPIMVQEVIRKIGELKKEQQLTVLMAEQNFNQATKICERGYFIVHGQITFVRNSHEDLCNNELVRKIYLGAPIKE